MRDWLLRWKNCVICGLSLDGNKIAHDLNRSKSYDKVMENLPFFLETYPHQPFKMTISSETVPYVADSIIEMEEKEYLFTANVPFEDTWGTPEQKTALVECYSKQIDRLVDYYVDRAELVPVSFLDRKLDVIGKKREEVMEDDVRWCGSGRHMSAIDFNGSFFPCHRFLPWVTKKPAPECTNAPSQMWKPEKCANCKIVFGCPVCVGYNWETYGDEYMRTTYHCEFAKLEVLGSAKIQALRFLKQPYSLKGLTKEEATEKRVVLQNLIDLVENGIE